MSDDEDGELLTGGKLWSGQQRERARQWLPEKLAPVKPEPEPEDRSYTAFDVRDRADRIQLQRATEPSRFPAYSYLLDISFDHHLQSAFTLFYSFGMVVEVTGENLGPIVHAIHFGTCERIREFHTTLHDCPAAGEPLVKAITIQLRKGVS
jgi:hypothetical protein